MIKRFISIILTLFLLSAFTFPAFASNATSQDTLTENGSITYFSDGSTLTTSPVMPVEDQVTSRATQTKTVYRTSTYKDSDGNVKWEFKLTATFSYEYGVSATCTKASYSKTINDSSWSFSDGSATKSGNVATGKGTFKFKVLFITTQTHNVTVTLTCDKYGNVT